MVTKTYYSTNQILPPYEEIDRTGYRNVFQIRPTISKVAIQEENPYWRDQVKKGENATTPRQLTVKSVFEAIPGEIVIPVTTGSARKIVMKGTLPHTQRWIPIQGPSASLLADISVARAHGRGKAYAKVDSLIHDNQTGVLLGELSQLARLLMNPLAAINLALTEHRKLVEYLIKSERVNVPGLNRLGKADLRKRIFADTWLEVQYGLLPLIRDVEGILMALSKLVNNRPVDLIKSSHVVFLDGPSSYYSDESRYGMRTHITESCKYELWTKAGIDTKITSGLQSQYTFQGLDLMSMPTTVWNLVPYSFLFDYVSNANQWLSSIFTATKMVKWVSQSEVITTELTMTLRDEGQAFPGNYGTTRSGKADINVPGTIKVRHKTIERRKDLAFPEFVLEIPSLKQCINVLALLVSNSPNSYARVGS